MKQFFLYSILFSSISYGETFRVELLTGTAQNFITPLTIQQVGQPTINTNAIYSTGSWLNESSAPYYDVRVGLWTDPDTGDGTGWELEFLHDKLYLVNLPPNVQQFQITFGYSMLFVNRAWEIYKWLIFRSGIGTVIAHPISTVNGLSYTGTEYVIAGIAGQLSLQARKPIIGGLSATVEVKYTNASAVVPVANGTAAVPNQGLQFLGGLGFDF